MAEQVDAGEPEHRLQSEDHEQQHRHRVDVVAVEEPLLHHRSIAAGVHQVAHQGGEGQGEQAVAEEEQQTHAEGEAMGAQVAEDARGLAQRGPVQLRRLRIIVG